MSSGIFAIARSGMDVEHQRMEVIAQNLANASTTRTATGGLYQPLKLVSGPQAPGSADSSFEYRLGETAASMNRNAPIASSHARASQTFAGVQTYGVEPTDAQPRVVYDPAHPHADARGFVQYPGIDHAGEMALMVQTLRVYEANTIMFNAGHAMYMRALDLGSKG